MATIKAYTSAAGRRWRVRYVKPDGNHTDKRGFATKREAEQWLAGVEVAKARGEYVPMAAGRITIGALGPAWLERQKGHMKPSWFRSYESAWRVHVQPRWGAVKLAEITYTDVQGWVAELAAKRGPVIVQTAHGVLARILDDAVRDRLLAANPARSVKLPRRTKRRNVYLSVAQLGHLADEAGRYRSLVMLLGTAGLRWGEAAALHVSDVDFLRRRIELHRNAVTVGRQTHVGSLKGGENRTVVLADAVVKELAITAEGKDRDELMWPSEDGGYLGPPSSTESWLSGAVARCQKIDPTFPRVTAHALRHTAASLAISAGANVKVVQRMLGHKSAAMTLDVYADLFDDDLSGVASKLDEILGKNWANRASEARQQAPKSPLPAQTPAV